MITVKQKIVFLEGLWRFVCDSNHTLSPLPFRFSAVYEFITIACLGTQINVNAITWLRLRGALQRGQAWSRCFAATSVNRCLQRSATGFGAGLKSRLSLSILTVSQATGDSSISVTRFDLTVRSDLQGRNIIPAFLLDGEHKSHYPRHI